MKHSPIYAYIKRVTAKESRYLVASENHKDLVGIPGSLLTGKTMEEIFPIDFARKISGDDRIVINKNTIINLEEDLNDRHLSTIKFPILLGGKKFLAGYTIDITEQKKSEAEIKLRVKNLQVLYESSIKLSNPLTLPEIGKTIIGILESYLEWHHAVVRYKRDGSDELEIIGFTAPGVTTANYQTETKRLKNLVGNTGKGMNGWAIQHKKAVRSGDLPSDPRYVKTFPGIHSGMYAPMIAEEKVLGIISIESETPNAFNELDEQLLSTLANITANAIQRNNHSEQTELQIQRLRALRAIDEAISANLDLKKTLDIFIKNAVNQLGADAAMLLLADPGGKIYECAIGYGLPQAIIKKIKIPVNEKDIEKISTTRQAMKISCPDLVIQLSNNIKSRSKGPFISCYATPIIVKDQVKGILEVFHRIALKPNSDWLGFFETLAGQAAIAIDNTQLFTNLQKSNFELSVAYDQTIEGWSAALDLRDNETEGHTQRVTTITQQLAISAGISGTDLVHIRRGCLLHDIGKVGVPDGILFKPRELTTADWIIMRKHPQLAFDLLSHISFLKPSLDIPYCHHEKWDGTGYPRGLKGEEIPLAARLFSVVDVWDALRSDRPYRKSWPEEKVKKHIHAESGTHFDPKAVELFFKLMEEEPFRHLYQTP